MLWRKLVTTWFWILFATGLAIVLLVNLAPDLWKASAIPTDLPRCSSHSASYSTSEQHPVILIPGFIGSSLTNLQQQSLWGQFSLISDFTRLALPLDSEIRHEDTLIPEQILPSFKVNLLGWQFEQDMYRQILHALGSGGKRCNPKMGTFGKSTEKQLTYFQFPYDWRQDNVRNAQRLHDFILEKQDYLHQRNKEKYGIDHTDIKFDIVAHSMGGLLTRYFLRYGDRDLPANGELPPVTWEGARYVNRVILIAPPNAGSLDSFTNLVYGTALYSPDPLSEPISALGVWMGRIGFGPANVHSNTVISGTFPSIYQMLPRGNYQRVMVRKGQKSQLIDDLFDVKVWENMQWGLLSPGADNTLKRLLPNISSASERWNIARSYVEKNLNRAKQFTRSLDQPAIAPQGLDLQLIAGDSLLTPQMIELSRTNRVKVIKTALGDGIVIKNSTLLDENIKENQASILQSPISWKKASFYAQNHLKLVQNASLIKDLLLSLQAN